jgi:hypothetical protein
MMDKIKKHPYRRREVKTNENNVRAVSTAVEERQLSFVGIYSNTA